MDIMDSSNSADGRGWQVGKSLVECWMTALDNQIDCDVTFLVHSDAGPSLRIPAHKLVLKVRSPVFEAMFGGAFLEAGQGEVEIKDINVEPFKELLRYIYSEQVHLTGSNVMKVLYAARKYIVVGLEELCHSYLSSQMTEDNVCSILSDSLVYMDEGLQKRCLEYIINNAKEVILSPEFLQLSHPALLRVLQEKLISCELELDFFQRSIEWAKHREADTDEDIREMLGECLRHFCFLAFTVEQFTAIASNSRVLTSDEKNAILFSIVSKNEQNIENMAKLGLNTASRIVCLPRFQTRLDGKYAAPADTKESFQFSVTKPLLLLGFSIYVGSKDSETEVNIEMKNNQLAQLQQGIANGANQGNDRLNITETVISNGSGKPQVILFKAPVKIENNHYHTVQAILKSSTETHLATNALTHAQLEGTDIIVNIRDVQPLQQYSATPNVQQSFVRQVFLAPQNVRNPGVLQTRRQVTRMAINGGKLVGLMFQIIL